MDKIIKYLIIAIIVLLPNIGSAQKNSCLEIDIMLVGDLSGSCSGFERNVGMAFDVFVDRFELSDVGIRIGIVTFNDNAILRSGLTSNKKKLKEICNQIKNSGADGTTNMKSALEIAGNELTILDPSKIGRAVPKLIILVTDGEPNNYSDVLTTSSQLQSIMGIGICGIYIRTGNFDNGLDYLKSICSNFCKNVVATDFNLLAEEMKKLDICL